MPPATQTDSIGRVLRMSSSGFASTRRSRREAPLERAYLPATLHAFRGIPVAAIRTCAGVIPAFAISSSSMCSK